MVYIKIHEIALNTLSKSGDQVLDKRTYLKGERKAVEMLQCIGTYCRFLSTFENIV